MMLSSHFADTELGVEPGSGATPQQVANAQTLCSVLLEPIRSQFGPIAVDDGYRTPEHNAAVGGAATSQHLYLGENSAADIRPLGELLETVFDWIRLESGLDWDQLILESHPGTHEPRCIHISYNGALQNQRRQALIGDTNGSSGYTHVAVGP